MPIQLFINKAYFSSFCWDEGAASKYPSAVQSRPPMHWKKFINSAHCAQTLIRNALSQINNDPTFCTSGFPSQLTVFLSGEIWRPPPFRLTLLRHNFHVRCRVRLKMSTKVLKIWKTMFVLYMLVSSIFRPSPSISAIICWFWLNHPKWAQLLPTNETIINHISS